MNADKKTWGKKSLIFRKYSTKASVDKHVAIENIVTHNNMISKIENSIDNAYEHIHSITGEMNSLLESGMHYLYQAYSNKHSVAVNKVDCLKKEQISTIELKEKYVMDAMKASHIMNKTKERSEQYYHKHIDNINEKKSYEMLCLRKFTNELLK